MKVGLVTIHTAASFINQTHYMYDAFVKQGWEVEIRDLAERFPLGEVWDRLVGFTPLWPNFLFTLSRLTASWFSRTHVIYGPIDGPFQPNLTLFTMIRNNMRLVACSEWVASCLRQNDLKVEGVVPHGIRHSDLKFPTKTIQAWRSQAKNRLILFSNINPLHRKGLPHLAQALQILPKLTNVKWIFILHTGRTKALQLAPQLAKTPNLIIEDEFMKVPYGKVLMKTVACDLYIHPSLNEGFGLPILEAMAAKKPIVCLDAPAMNELVDSTCGWIFPYEAQREELWDNGARAQLFDYNPKNLAETIAEAINNWDQSLEKAEKAYRKSLEYSHLKVYPKLLTI